MKYAEVKILDGGLMQIVREVTEEEFNERKNDKTQVVYPFDPADWRGVYGKMVE